MQGDAARALKGIPIFAHVIASRQLLCVGVQIPLELTAILLPLRNYSTIAHPLEKSINMSNTDRKKHLAQLSTGQDLGAR